MEITKVFKACVKASKTRKKIEGSSDILPKSRKKTKEEASFNSRAIDVVSLRVNIFLLTLFRRGI